MKTYEIQQRVTNVMEAEVVEFLDGQCALLWTSVMAEIQRYPSLEEVKRVAVNTRRKLVRINDNDYKRKSTSHPRRGKEKAGHSLG